MAKTMTVEESLLRDDTYCGVKEWHENGITGKNIHVWNCEDLSDHGQISTRRVGDGAPNAIVHNAGISCKRDNDHIEYIYVDDDSDKKWDIEDWIRTHNIRILTRSKAGGFARKSSGVYYDYWKEVQKKYNLIIFNSAGNDSSEARSYDEGSDMSVLVGAVNLMSNGTVKPASYTSVNDDVDFATFTGVWSGTSFSCPYLAGICAMLLERYGDMSQTEIYKYFKMIARDVNNDGNDDKTGYGIPILPKFDKKYVTMTTKSNTYYVSGKAYEMDTKPVNKNGNVLVPIRVISESLGATVDWQFNPDKTIKVSITKGTTKIELNTNSNAVIINGEVKFLNVEPYIDENNRTLVPIRFIAEGLDCMVDWVQKDAKVMILEK